MVNNLTLSNEEPMSARSEIAFVNHRESDKKKSRQSQLKVTESKRSGSQRSVHPLLSTSCAHCKLPSLIDVDRRETINRSRASATFQSGRLCQECNQEKAKNGHSPASRLLKSVPVNWSTMSDKIENWFEKAQTPDQRVVYNFLEKINDEPMGKSTEPVQEKSLNDILDNLKKYRTRFNSPRSRSKLTRVFESSSWRVMRHPSTSDSFSRCNAAYGDEASRDLYHSSIFTTTYRRKGSTYLLDPNWV